MSKRGPRARGEGTGMGTLKGTVATIIKWTQGILGLFVLRIRNTTQVGGEKRGGIPFQSLCSAGIKESSRC